MRILLVGASGFIGSALARALLQEGHDVTGLGRDTTYGQRILPAVRWVRGDLRTKSSPEDWLPLLGRCDVVINASGALQTGLRDNVGKVQADAIMALIAAARQAEVRHIVQISAAGAERLPDNDFMASKLRADAALLDLASGYTVLRPGLVIGRNCFGGTELLRAAAGLPLFQFEISGTGPVQCVALMDVVDAVLRVVAEPEAHVGSFDLVERDSRTLGEVIALHRDWLGIEPASIHVRIPVAMLRPLTLLADLFGWLGWRSPLRSNAIAALVAGVSGNAEDLQSVLGRHAVSLPQALDGLGAAGKADRWHARLAAMYPLALGALVVLWLASGIIGLVRLDEAAGLLIASGIQADLARFSVVAGSLADVGIALGIIFRPTLGLALKAGILLALTYCIGSLVIRPDLWLDPLAPMIKVIPVIVLSMVCLAMAEER